MTGPDRALTILIMFVVFLLGYYAGYTRALPPPEAVDTPEQRRIIVICEDGKIVEAL